jgi:hypothetical protein
MGLVLQPIDDRRSALKQAVSDAQVGLLVVSPFIDKSGANAILEAIGTNRLALRVLTRLEREVLVSGPSDPDAIELLLDAGARFKTLDRLHSKAYIVDKRQALFGSANLTGGGLIGNHELLLSSTDAAASGVIPYALGLWDLGKSKPGAWIRDLCEQARLMRRRYLGQPSTGDDDDLETPELDLVYIPKNAKERSSSFDTMLRCTDWASAETIRGDDHVENVRDVLDFGTYLGLLSKRGVHPGEGRGTAYKLKESGKTMCEAVRDRLPNAPENLANRLVQYGMPNRYINLHRTPQHAQCRVRPWLTLLRLLDRIERDVSYSGDGFSPTEMAFVVLSVFHESPREMQSAFRHLRRLDVIADAQGRRNQLAEWIEELGLDPQRLWNAKAGIPARLCRWPHYTGLVECTTSEPTLTDFYDLLDADITIHRVTGLTVRGRALVGSFAGTVYSPPQFAMEET